MLNYALLVRFFSSMPFHKTNILTRDHFTKKKLKKGVHNIYSLMLILRSSESLLNIRSPLHSGVVVRLRLRPPDIKHLRVHLMRDDL